jgi:hypothetical protein
MDEHAGHRGRAPAEASGAGLDDVLAVQHRSPRRTQTWKDLRQGRRLQGRQVRGRDLHGELHGRVEEFSGIVDFGGGPLVSAGNNDVFVVKLDMDGKYLWGRTFGDGQQQSGAGLAFYDAKGLVVAGRLKGTIDFGGDPLISMSNQDIFLAKLLTP